MHLVDTKEIKDARAPQLPPLMKVYAPKSNDWRSVAPIKARKGQHLDVDGILARSLPNSLASPAPDIKTRASR